MTNLLDERIDQLQNMDWTHGRGLVCTLFHGAQYKGIAEQFAFLRFVEQVSVFSRYHGLEPEICGICGAANALAETGE
jgi:hypothetical protein